MIDRSEFDALVQETRAALAAIRKDIHSLFGRTDGIDDDFVRETREFMRGARQHRTESAAEQARQSAAIQQLFTELRRNTKVVESVRDVMPEMRDVAASIRGLAVFGRIVKWGTPIAALVAAAIAWVKARNGL